MAPIPMASRDPMIQGYLQRSTPPVLIVLGFACLVGVSLSSAGSPARRAPSAPAPVLPAVAAATSDPAVPDLVPDEPLPGMPAVLDPQDIYSETRVGKLSPVVQGFPERVYVPNSLADTVHVIDPKTYEVIDQFSVGRVPQHVTPSYDLKTLWVLNNEGNTLTRIDPATGKKGETIPIIDPYNLYYTPDGQYAIVVAERLKRLDFYDPQTMQVVHRLSVPCRGVDHMDFSANGRYLIASCEFSSEMIKVDVAARQVLGKLKLPRRGQPQDVKTSPDGKVFYVADMIANGVYLLDGDRFTILSFLPTGDGAHGLYPSRDSKFLYVSNRGEGSVSLIDFATRQVVKKWHLPGGGSPDMGGVSADGKVLWLAGRYHSEVYALDTSSGRLLARIPVGKGAHGLCIYPQPGRYSLGHTGVLR